MNKMLNFLLLSTFSVHAAPPPTVIFISSGYDTSPLSARGNRSVEWSPYLDGTKAIQDLEEKGYLVKKIECQGLSNPRPVWLVVDLGSQNVHLPQTLKTIGEHLASSSLDNPLVMTRSMFSGLAAEGFENEMVFAPVLDAQGDSNALKVAITPVVSYTVATPNGDKSEKIYLGPEPPSSGLSVARKIPATSGKVEPNRSGQQTVPSSSPTTPLKSSFSFELYSNRPPFPNDRRLVLRQCMTAWLDEESNMAREYADEYQKICEVIEKNYLGFSANSVQGVDLAKLPQEAKKVFLQDMANHHFLEGLNKENVSQFKLVGIHVRLALGISYLSPEGTKMIGYYILDKPKDRTSTDRP